MTKRLLSIIIVIEALLIFLINFVLLSGRADLPYVDLLEVREDRYIKGIQELSSAEFDSSEETIQAYKEFIRNMNPTSNRNRYSDIKTLAYRLLIDHITNDTDLDIKGLEDELVELEPLQYLNYKAIGNHYYKREGFEKAAEYYHKAFQLTPDNEDIYRGLTDSLAKLDQAEEVQVLRSIFLNIYHTQTFQLDLHSDLGQTLSYTYDYTHIGAEDHVEFQVFDTDINVSEDLNEITKMEVIPTLSTYFEAEDLIITINLNNGESFEYQDTTEIDQIYQVTDLDSIDVSFDVIFKD